MWRRLAGVLLIGSLLPAAGGGAPGQRQRFGGQSPEPALPDVPYDGRFTFARLRFTTGPGGYYYGGLPAWAHGYARAERNFTKILQTVTNIDVHTDASKVISIDDPELFNYPVAYMAEPDYLTLNDQEVSELHAYLKKGGFIIFDDFRDNRGNPGWAIFEGAMDRIMPGGRLVQLDATHPIYHSFFEIRSLDMFVQAYDRGTPMFYGMFEDNDPRKPLMLVANYNNDISDYWEFSDQGYLPIDQSNEAYKLGVNYVIYGLTH